MVKVLDLAHNALQSLDGIQQFPHLTTLILDYNLLDSISELSHLHSHSSLTKLSLIGNPMSLHPDLVPSVLRLIPILKEINGMEVTENTFQEIELGETLANGLITYFYRNERMLIALDQDTKRIKLAFELATFHGKSDTNMDLKSHISDKIEKLPEFPVLPFSAPENINPSTILSYISMIETHVQPLFPYVSDTFPFEISKITHWLYTELILRLHNSGYFELHRYLQRRYYNSPTLDEEFNIEFSEFLMLNTQKSEDWPSFPIFSCNFQYLKALFDILETQMDAFETLYADYRSLLESMGTELEDFLVPESPPSCITPPQLPSFLDKSRDIDLIELFPDEYTFRKREMGKELRKIKAEEGNRQRLIRKMWRKWRKSDGNYEKNREIEEWSRRKIMRKVLKKLQINIKIPSNFPKIHRKYLLSISFHAFSRYLRFSTLLKSNHSSLSSKISSNCLKLHFSQWHFLYLSRQKDSKPTKKPDESRELFRDIDRLLGKIKAVESSLSQGIGRLKSKAKGGKKQVKASELHWQMREMSAKTGRTGS